MILRLLEAKNEDTISEYSNIIRQLRAIGPEWFNDLKDASINKIIIACSKDLGKNRNDLSAEDIADWASLNETAGEFVINNIDNLSADSIADIGKHDNKFVKVIFDVAKACKWIDDDGNELGSFDEITSGKPARSNASKMSFEQIIREFFEDRTPEKMIRMMQILDDGYRKGFIDVHFSRDDIKIMHEDVEEAEVETVEGPAEEPSTANTTIETPELEIPAEKPTDEIVVNNAYCDLLNELVKGFWEMISKVNGAIASFDYDFTGAEKESIQAILNQVSDDVTISIGMIHKAMELVKPQTAELRAEGEEKAEEIISEPATTDLE